MKIFSKKFSMLQLTVIKSIMEKYKNLHENIKNIWNNSTNANLKNLLSLPANLTTRKNSF